MQPSLPVLLLESLQPPGMMERGALRMCLYERRPSWISPWVCLNYVTRRRIRLYQLSGGKGRNAVGDWPRAAARTRQSSGQDRIVSALAALLRIHVDLSYATLLPAAIPAACWVGCSGWTGSRSNRTFKIQCFVSTITTN